MNSASSKHLDQSVSARAQIVHVDGVDVDDTALGDEEGSVAVAEEDD